MKFQRPRLADTDARRKLVEDMIRTRQIRSVPQLQEILREEHNIDVVSETVRLDLNRIGAAKDSATGLYLLQDTQLTRFDLYMMLKHACQTLLHDMRINRSGDTVFLYADIGTAKRFQYFLEGIRQDEILAGERRAFHDHILATIASEDTVIVYFNDGSDGRKFLKKMEFLAEQSSDLEWVDGFEEKNLMTLIMGDEE